jgi:glycerol kinase
VSNSRSAVVVAVDQGTSSTKSVAMDAAGTIVGSASVPLGQRNSRPGWIEQDPEEILASVVRSLGQVAAEQSGTIATVGLSSQRESALVWDTASGEALGPLLGWQDRRTAERASELAAQGWGETIRERSGLPLDPMFSALKFEWLLDQVDPDRTKARSGAITVGTVDAWLVQRLTGDRRIEAGNASRTQLLNIATAQWDDDLLDIFNIPQVALPPVVSSNERSGRVLGLGERLAQVRIDGVLGDSHAALFAHGVRIPGQVKTTYGTGSSIMGLTGGPVPPASGMVQTIAWQLGSPVTAFEGNILSIGSTLLWLADVLECTPDALDVLAQSVPDSAGVHLVPAFSGLGAPWWDEKARSVLVGFGPGNGRAHLARAAFESIPFQVEDVLERADAVSGVRITTVLADGGPTRNDWLMQRQADLASSGQTSRSSPSPAPRTSQASPRASGPSRTSQRCLVDEPSSSRPTTKRCDTRVGSRGVAPWPDRGSTRAAPSSSPSRAPSGPLPAPPRSAGLRATRE